MKALTKILTLTTALALVAWGCKPEASVEPTKNGAPEIGQALSPTHPDPEPPCMPAVTYPLVDDNGNYAGNPDDTYWPSAQPYGTVTTKNSPDIFYVLLDAGGAWSFSGARVFIGQCSQVTFKPDGTVNDEVFPWQTDVNPVRGAFNVQIPMADIVLDASGCACLVVRLEMCGLDANGDCSGSWWVWGDGGNTLGTNGRSMTVCPIACPEGRPEKECYALNPAGGVTSTTLRVVMTKGNPPYTYTWYSGSVGGSTVGVETGGGWTSQPVTVSPTTTSQWWVVVCDDAAVTCDTVAFTVYPTADGCCAVPVVNQTSNLSAWNCTTGNGQQKVRVCHLPPGNPANRQNICIAVTALPAHIVDFKPLTNPCMGHHSGCHIGPCDPCGPGSSQSSIDAAAAFMLQHNCPGN